jgi:ABC-2 type transport system ATP-binding protein
MTDAPSLEIDCLTKTFGNVVAVSELSMSIRAGEIYCFLGPNGAGKTTTLNTIIGRKMPTSGDVLVNGVSLRSPDIEQARRRIGYMPEQPVLYDYLTGREFIQFIGRVYGADQTLNDWLEERLSALQMSDDADRLIKDYSAGMKKKISFLAALAHGPDTLIFDEPTGALDAPSARVVKDEMVAARNRGSLVFFTTHVMELAERLADRIAIIDHGRLVTEGTLQELRAAHGRRSSESLESLFLRLIDHPESNTEKGT